MVRDMLLKRCIIVVQVVANETKVVVQREETEATKKATETQAIADDAQRDLDEALPALVLHLLYQLVTSLYASFHIG